MKNYLLKISSAGNRFLIADKRWFESKPHPDLKGAIFETGLAFSNFLKLAEQPASNRKALIDHLISHKELSLTDGLVVLKENKKFLFECDFYNKDGSTAEMCGNAACCLSFYADLLSLPLAKPFRLGTQILSRRKGGGIVLNQKPALIAGYDFTFQEERRHFILVDSGAPHAVLECPGGDGGTKKAFGAPHAVLECPLKKPWDFEDRAYLKKAAKHLRFKNPKDKKGMNISFFKVEKPYFLQAITYERGIEDWTLACGTGALAAACVYLNSQADKQKTVFVNMPGGRLKIQIYPETTLFSPVKKGH